MTNSSCYIYAYRVDGELWIIGKGHGRRNQKHLARARRCAKGLPMHRIYGWQRELADRLNAGATVTIERLAENLSEPDALTLERKLIAELKPLKNKMPGGEGGRLLAVHPALAGEP
jgi:hypothetical protein